MIGRRVGPRVAGVVAGLARASAYLAVVAALVAFFAARALHARIGEQTLAAGRELAQFKDLLQGIHRVVLNGESVYVAGAVTQQTMAEVLDRFERQCAARSGGLAQEFDALSETDREKMIEKAPFAFGHRLGIVREAREKEASILCVEQRDGRGLIDLVARLQAFAASGDASEVGNLRYVYVRPTDTGKTQVLTTLTEGSFNLYKLLGAGSAEPPGTDPPAVPRLPGSRRMMSAALEGSMYGAYLFTSSRSPADALQFYDSGLPGRGWSLLLGHPDLAMEVWQREGVTMTLQAASDDEENRTVVTFVQARTTPPAPGG
jgi:hypothetical protein